MTATGVPCEGGAAAITVGQLKKVAATAAKERLSSFLIATVARGPRVGWADALSARQFPKNVGPRPLAQPAAEGVRIPIYPSVRQVRQGKVDEQMHKAAPDHRKSQPTPWPFCRLCDHLLAAARPKLDYRLLVAQLRNQAAARRVPNSDRRHRVAGCDALLAQVAHFKVDRLALCYQPILAYRTGLVCHRRIHLRQHRADQS